MNNSLIFSIITTCMIVLSTGQCHAEPQKEHEKWWTENTPKMFDTFDGWLGDTNSTSRVLAREHIKKMDYKTILDVPCGTCTEYLGYKQEEMPIAYTGLDITAYLVNRAKKMGINAVEGSIEKIPFKDSSFEIVYSRHILEHLDYYELALNEAIRVAKNEVLVVFFINPSTTAPDSISRAPYNGAILYHNRYNRDKLNAFVTKNPKVKSTKWEDIGGIANDESFLHIYLK